jgi:5-methylthioadenosine/S-adenosylhomocysteine deaminase
MKTILTNLTILDMINENTYKGEILINGDVIEEIGIDINKDHVNVIDCSNMLAMPGLINSHTHIAMSLLRNYADDMAFWPWLTEKIWPKENKLDDEKVYWGSMLSIAEMIQSGTTTFSDMYFFCEQTIKAVEESGIRAVISRGLISGDQFNEKFQNSKDLFSKYDGTGEGRISIALGPHAPYTVNELDLKNICLESDKTGQRIHIHISESENENNISLKDHSMTPMKYLDKIGFLNEKTMAAHCVYLDDEDINIAKKRKINILHNPSSNMKLANGFARVDKMLKEGINVSLGTDGPSSNNNQDMFEEMHLAAMISKGFTKDPQSLNAFEVLKMATINGAKALGIDNIGSLKVGNKADIILIDYNKPHMIPINNLVSAIVYSSKSTDVDTVFINGKMVMKNRKLLTLDLENILVKAQECADKLLED